MDPRVYTSILVEALQLIEDSMHGQCWEESGSR